MSSLFVQAVRRFLEERRRTRAIERIDALVGRSQVAPTAVEEIRRGRRTADRGGD